LVAASVRKTMAVSSSPAQPLQPLHTQRLQNDYNHSAETVARIEAIMLSTINEIKLSEVPSFDGIGRKPEANFSGKEWIRRQQTAGHDVIDT
jgi:hypothetical protein